MSAKSSSVTRPDYFLQADFAGFIRTSRTPQGRSRDIELTPSRGAITIVFCIRNINRRTVGWPNEEERFRWIARAAGLRLESSKVSAEYLIVDQGECRRATDLFPLRFS
jgi:hypothetical protein